MAQGHASVATYWKIAIILAIITFGEVIYPFVTEDIIFLQYYYMPILAAMSLVKFFLVVGYFMHLKFDKPILKIIFYFSLMIALLLFVAMLFLFFVINI